MAIKAEDKPCWVAICDGCGDGDNEEYGGSYHYESEQETTERIRELEWTEHDGFWLCRSCSQDRPEDEVDCPACGAVAPAGCRQLTPSNELVFIPHPERLAAYVKKLKAEPTP